MADYDKSKAMPTASTVEVDEKGSPVRPKLHKGGHSHHFRGRKRVVTPDTNEIQRIGYDGEADRRTGLGKVYDKIISFGPARYILYVVPVGVMLAVPIIIQATRHPHWRMGGAHAFAFCIWLEFVWLGLWVSKVGAMALPKLFQACCGMVSAGTRKHAELLKRLEFPLTLMLWTTFAWASLIIVFRLNHAYPDDGNSWVHFMTISLVSLMCCAAAFLAEKSVIQLITVNYHRKRLHARLHDSKRTISLLAQMYERSTHWFPEYCQEFADEDYLIKDTILRALVGKDQGSRALQAHIKVLGDVGRIGEKVGWVFGRVGTEITGAASTRLEQARQTVLQALETRVSSEALARRLWWSFVCEERDSMVLEDVVDVLGNHRQEEAEEVFAQLDKDGNGDISLQEMILMVSEVSRERKALIRSGNDVQQAIKALDNVLMIIYVLVVAVIFIAFFNKKWIGQAWALATPLAALGFSTQDTVKEFLNSCVFLFIKHPFDIGDRVDISSTQLVVEHISLLYTVFRRVDTNRAVQIPNTVSNALWIENVTRSQAMKEQLTIAVHAGTTFEDVEALRDEVRKFLRDPDNARDFKPDFEIHTSIAKLGEMDLMIEIQYKSNWSNEHLRITRRNRFMHAFIAAMRRVPIYGPAGAKDHLAPVAAAGAAITAAATSDDVSAPAIAMTTSAATPLPAAAATLDIPLADSDTDPRRPSHVSAVSDVVRPSFDGGERKEARSHGRRKAHGGPQGETSVNVDEITAAPQSNGSSGVFGATVSQVSAAQRWRYGGAPPPPPSRQA